MRFVTVVAIPLLHQRHMQSTVSQSAPVSSATGGATTGVLVRGSAWTAAGRALAALSRLVVSVTAARVLVPADFGLMGLALLATATLHALSETGVERAFVQRKDVDGYADVAWTLLLGRSVLLSLILLALADPMARFYAEPQLVPILSVMAVAVAVGGVRNVSSALLNRQLAFQRLFGVEVSLGVAQLVLGLFFVLVFRNVWALVLSHLATAIVEVAISYAVHPHRPRIHFDREKALELLRFGRWVTAVGVLALLVTRADDMFISKYLGAEALGVYVLAFEIANIPTTQVTHVLGRVSFPTYARLHAASDPAELRLAFARVMRATLVLSGLVTVLLAFGVEGLVEYVLGAQWRPAIPLVRILLIGGFLRSLVGLAAALFHAVGRPDLDFRMNAPRLLILTLLIWPACAYGGLVGAVWLVTFAVASCLPLWLRGVREFTGLTVRDLVAQALPAAVVTGALTLAWTISKLVVAGQSLLSAVAQMVIALAMSAAIVGGLERTTPLRMVTELKRLRSALRNGRSTSEDKFR